MGSGNNLACSSTGLCGAAGNTATSMAPEQVFAWTPTVTGTAVIDTCNGQTDFDTVVYMKASPCLTGPEMTCNDDSPTQSPACLTTQGAPTPSRITPSVTAPNTYYIVVDGKGTVNHNFTLNVRNPTTTTTITSATTTTTLSQNWAKRFGGSAIDHARGVATDSDGNIIMAGYFQGTVNFGGTDKTSNGGFDIILAKYTSTGVQIWSKPIGGGSNDFVYSIAIDGSKNIVMTGNFTGTVAFGTTPATTLTSVGLSDIFVAKYDTDGNCIWAKRFGAGGNETGYGIAVDSSNNIFVTGSFLGTVNFGGAALFGAAGDSIFIAKYDSNGNHVWSRTALESSSTFGHAIAVDASGNAFVTGVFGGFINFEGTSSQLNSNGGYDVFVVKLGASTGTGVWSKEFGGASESDNGSSIAVDHSGNVVVVGNVYNTVDFGGGPVLARSIDGYVVNYGGASGTYNWSRLFTEDYTASSVANSVTINNSNEVVVTGNFTTTSSVGVDFGTGPLLSAGSYDIFAVRYASSGAPIWSQRYGGTSDDVGYGVVYNTNGNIIITGDFQGTTNLGFGSLPSAGYTDFFLSSFPPS